MSKIVGSTYGLTPAQTDFTKILIFAGILVLVLAISIFSPYLGIVALTLLLCSLVVGCSLTWSVLALAFLLPIDPQVEVKPGFFVYFDLFFILPALVYFWKVVFAKLRVNWWSLALGPYVLFAVASCLGRAENLYWFAGYSSRLVIAVLFMSVVACVGRAETVTLVLATGLISQVIYGLYQLTVGDLGTLYTWIYPHFKDQIWNNRARGLFFTDNNLGGYCAIVLVMLLALAQRSRSAGSRLFSYSMAAVSLIGLASSGSRGAWLASMAGIAVLLVCNRKNLSMKFALTAVVVIAILVASAAAMMQYEPLQRSVTLDDYTVEGRSTAYIAAGLLFLQHPLIGVGLTNYQELMSSVVNWDLSASAAHNTYLQILSENGLLGFVLFFGPVLYVLVRNLKAAKQSTSALIVAVALTVFLVHGLFDFQLMTAPQYLLLFAILMGLGSQTLAPAGWGRSRPPPVGPLSRIALWP